VRRVYDHGGLENPVPTVTHARDTDAYEVTVKIADQVCVIEVTDSGAGFVPPGQPRMPPDGAVSGRGLYLIAQLSDDFELTSDPAKGTTVRFAKRLTYTDGTDPGATDRR
jgi:serine/threonine-protein kinase RsbW